MACGNNFDGERAMDSNVLEMERGITITSKYTRVHYKEHILHIVDTPGKVGLAVVLFCSSLSLGLTHFISPSLFLKVMLIFLEKSNEL